MPKSLLACAFALCAALAATSVVAQPYPSRPLHVVVPFPAGGSADTLARLIGQDLSEQFGQSVVVENRTGAGGNLGTDLVAKAAPDGYTLLLTPSSIAIAPALYAKLPFDPVKDFKPVTLVGNIPMVVVVHPSFPAKTLGELVSYVKSQPGKVNYASAGLGTTNHLAVELFKLQAGIDMVHVPYRGNPLAMVDVIAGQVPVFFDFVLTGLPHVKGGAVRGLATTGAARSTVMPELPTVREAGLGDFEASTWFGVYAPNNTPNDVIAKLDEGIAKALAKPAIKDRLQSLGVEMMPRGPQALGDLTRNDLAKWGPVIQKAGIKPE